jgi:hypothetical protein
MSALSLERINQTDLVGFLAFLGHHPEKISGGHYWYRSPLHGSRTDRDHFHVNRRTNRWYDFDLAAGYTFADFALCYFPDEQTFIQNLQQFVSTKKENVQQPELRTPSIPSPTIEIAETYRVRSLVLMQYLWERRIPLSVAHRFCVEARYTRENRTYCALGFPTDASGYILFGPRHRYHTGPNSPTHFANDRTEVAVFLDCLDLLTFAGLQPSPRLQPDLLCLNQPDNLATVLPRLETYSLIRLFFPNTTSGDKLTQATQRNNSHTIDYRPLYKRYNSLNEWVCHFGKGNQPTRPSNPANPP